ncbi:MAG: NAD(P)/FAD-dependent oxidoreductase [Saprospiraceae bacterium]|nr:NAD(P)/FAD-dependent oxidoreductase [Saprospiraceae bacterium]
MRIIIVGGGAAGFFAAIRCAELRPDAQVTILERGKDVLGKVKISGGGRCNVTHACYVPRELIKFYPRGAKELLGPFNRFACGDTQAWFEDRGVPLKIEQDGRIFPISDRSSSIMNCLIDATQSLGIQVLTHKNVTDLTPPANAEDPWIIHCQKGETFQADKLMMASGSNKRIWQLLGQLGHEIVAPAPSLFTFNIKDPRIQDLPGVSVPLAEINLPSLKLKTDGPLLITHWGLSGPAILKLSAWGARALADCQYEFEIQVNWIAENYEATVEVLNENKRSHSKKKVFKNTEFALPSRLWQSLLRASGIRFEANWADLNKKQMLGLAQQLTCSTFQVKGKSTNKEEFVTAGGIQLKEINFKTFSSKILPNLYLAGEVLNIDALTGGFNFQAAWTGGWISGEAMAQD